MPVSTVLLVSSQYCLLTVYYKNFMHTIIQNYSYLDENMYKKQHRKKANVQERKYLM